jgi:gamma-glutamyltranspeptidase / glutathione hydrolase
MNALARWSVAIWLAVPSMVLAQGMPTETPIAKRTLTTVTASKQLVATANPYATQAGLDILRAGGSAVDAAITVQLVLSLVEPQSSGIGGGGFLLHHDGKSGAITSYDGRETAPASATEGLFLNADGKPLGMLEALPGGRTVGVPGALRLMEVAHRKHGKLAWKRLFKPAIKLANKGFVASPRLVSMTGNAARFISRFPQASALLLDSQGQPLAEGTRIRSKAYARLLQTLARRGADAYYTGPSAERIITAVTTSPVAPVSLTQEDLITYKVIEREPVCGTYRVWRICSMGPPSSGGLAVLMTLKMVERFDLKALGPDNPRSYHLIGQAMALAFADREVFVADPAFVAVPTAGMLDSAYLASRSALIDPARALVGIKSGQPPGAKQAVAHAGPDVPSTSHWVVADRDGNVVTNTGTVQGPFGAFLAVDGYFLNNELTDFSFVGEKDGVKVANRVEPGKRPRSSMSPTIVTDAQGNFVMALGSAGGSRIIAHVIKTLVASLDWGMDMQQAVNAPNFANGGNGLELEQGTHLEAMKPALEGLGNTVLLRSSVSGVQALRARRDGSGRLIAYEGAADPRREGIVLGD